MQPRSRSRPPASRPIVAYWPALPEPSERPNEREGGRGISRTLEPLGHGGFAPVWLARGVYEGVTLRFVAVKLFDVSAPSGAAAKARRSSIVAEAAALCRVEHPNVVRFHTLAIDEGRGVIGLVMEYAAGRALSARIEAEGTLAFDDTLAAGLAVASALSAVHRVGLVHRDVKPHDLIEVGARYKLIDFGIAAASHEGPPGQARPVAVVRDLPLETRGTKMSTVVALGEGREASITGTVGYVDPHVVRTGASSTAASDLYALGAMLFECATGRLPAAAQTTGIRGEVLDGRAPAPSLRRVRSDVPTRFADLVDALLRPRPEHRPSSAEEVARELEHVRAEWEAGKARRRLQLLPGDALAALRGALAEADRRVAAGDRAGAVDVHAVALRDVLAGPLAGAGHEVAGALLIAARVRLAEVDSPEIVEEVGFLVSALVAAHGQLLESQPLSVDPASRYGRDDPASARRLLETRFSPPEGVRAGSVLTSLLRELRSKPDEHARLPAASQVAVDAAIDAAVDALALAARATAERDVEGAVAVCEACARRILASLSMDGATRPLVEMLEKELSVMAEAGTRDASVEAMRRGMLRVVAQRW